MAVIDHEAILRQIPAEEKTLTPPASVFHTRIHPFKRSPIMLRPRKSRKARTSCSPADIIVHEDPHTPSGSSEETSDVETPSKIAAWSIVMYGHLMCYGMLRLEMWCSLTSSVQRFEAGGSPSRDIA